MLFNKTLDKQLEKRPLKVMFCKKCVISNQRPRITFDENGVCGACNYAYQKHNVIDWSEREKMLVDLLNKYRSKDGSYDCIVPGSGGKDSGYVAHQLKYKYGMHPLTITFAPSLYTRIGWENYLNFINSGFDNLLCSPNGILSRKLSRLSFELVGDNFQPFIFGVKYNTLQTAVRYKIPLVFFGESGEIEYGGSEKYINKPFEDFEDWGELYFKGFGINNLVKEGLDIGYLTEEEAKGSHLEFYRPPDLEEVKKIEVQMHWFSFYKKWIPKEHCIYSKANTGFQEDACRSEGTYTNYASLDDKTDGFHYYLSYIKFGIGRATSDASHEIRDRQLTREEGVSLVHKYDSEMPDKYRKETYEYLGINQDEFCEVINFYRSISPHLWEKVGGEWSLKYRVEND